MSKTLEIDVVVKPIIAKKFVQFVLLTICLVLIQNPLFSQKAYFADGFHGGVFGHYPEGFMQFIVDELHENPEWKINLEIEPFSWDIIKDRDPEAYNSFIKLYSSTNRIEITNPGFAQSYLFATSGESNIRQFTFGIRETNKHFPSFDFMTYATEEPCFTSSLPFILKSFGVKYAVLKNPNTCWGGYTSAYGGDLVNWVGPDGAKITTVPRYKCEQLASETVWQTESWNNSSQFIQKCFTNGIKKPVGMCYQDAGWRRGPWLESLNNRKIDVYEPSIYTTWSNYFENISVGTIDNDWNFSQEDMHVSLMWGSQILQQIAQQVRIAENKIIQAEKIAVMAKLWDNYAWPTELINDGWENLLLAQHHDCWIVPYNKKSFSFLGKSTEKLSWAEWVEIWTNTTNTNCDKVIQSSFLSNSDKAKKDDWQVTVFNTLGFSRKELITIPLPEGIENDKIQITSSLGQNVPCQYTNRKSSIILEADVPAMGYQSYKIENGTPFKPEGANASKLENGLYKLESDLYTIIIDPSKGGVIKSLVSNSNAEEFVDELNERGFNEMRGYFREEGRFISSMEKEATVNIIETGPLRVVAEVTGLIGSTSFKQTIKLTQGQVRIDFSIELGWKGNTEIGKPASNTDREKLRRSREKAFYDDRYKLLVNFPSAMQSPKLFKNAPFDVCESKLNNTFFNSWDSIKHNIILNWVDLYDSNNNKGLAVLTDHTSSYVYGDNYPIALTLQYSGYGLWGRNYLIDKPTAVNYAIIPHASNWQQSGIEMESTKWNEPLIYTNSNENHFQNIRNSLVEVSDAGIQITALYYENNDLLMRVYNTKKVACKSTVKYNFKVDRIDEIHLNGDVIAKIEDRNTSGYKRRFELSFSKHGVKTIKFINARSAEN